jgi:hypothetical protein
LFLWKLVQVYLMLVIFFQKKVLKILKKGTHRAPIIDKDGKMISIVTQGDVIKFVSKHVKDLGDFGKKTVSELNLGTKGVYTIEKKKKLLMLL